MSWQNTLMHEQLEFGSWPLTDLICEASPIAPALYHFAYPLAPSRPQKPTTGSQWQHPHRHYTRTECTDNDRRKTPEMLASRIFTSTLSRFCRSRTVPYNIKASSVSLSKSRSTCQEPSSRGCRRCLQPYHLTFKTSDCSSPAVICTAHKSPYTAAVLRHLRQSLELLNCPSVDKTFITALSFSQP